MRCGRLTSRALVLVLVGSALVAGVARASGTGTTLWSFTVDPGVRIPAGVSTEALRLSDGTVLAYVGTMRGELAYRSSDGLSFTQVSGRLPGGNDPAVVPLPDGRYRMYYTVCNPCSGADSGKEIRSAVSSDGLDWTPEAGTRLVMGTSRVGGVPDAVVLPDGRVRIYYLPSLDNERIDSATSSDGLSFTPDPGDRLTGGYVDPAVVRLPDGSWLMLVSRTPREQQRLFLARSADGLAWTVDPKPVLDPAGRANALDPTLLPLPDGSFRVYYSAAAAGQQLAGPYSVVSGVLTPTAAATLAVRVRGRGSVGGGRLTGCTAACSVSLAPGTTVTLRATPAKGYRLGSWSGACTGRKAACVLAVTADESVGATFVKKR